MRVLVTGSSGQVGSYMVEALRAAGHEPVGFDLLPGPFTSVVGDIRDASDVAGAIRGCDAVIHLAAQVSVPASVEDAAGDAGHNIIGTIRVLDAARAAGVSRVVYTSSAAAYGTPEAMPVREDHPTRPIAPYGLSKLAGEKYAFMYHALHGLPVTSVRPFNIYSKRQDPSNPYSGVLSHFASRLKKGEAPVIHGDGLQTRDFVHATDVAQALLTVLTHPDAVGRPFNIGRGEETTILAVAEAMIRARGIDVKPAFAPARHGDIRESVADVAALKGLGWAAKVALEDGVRELLD